MPLYRHSFTFEHRLKAHLGDAAPTTNALNPRFWRRHPTSRTIRYRRGDVDAFVAGRVKTTTTTA
jgi:hypothetical protein